MHCDEFFQVERKKNGSSIWVCVLFGSNFNWAMIYGILIDWELNAIAIWSSRNQIALFKMEMTTKIHRLCK